MSKFIVDLHIHTRYGSACSRLEPQALVAAAKKLGLSAVGITEHDYLWDADKIRDLASSSGLIIFRGIEVASDQGHLLVFGLEVYPKDISCAERLREAVDRTGGVIIAAHPYRHTPGAVSWKKMGKRPVFRLAHEAEAFNGISSDTDNEMAFQLCRRLGFRGVAASDAHAPHQVGLGVTIFDSPIRNDQELAEALKAKAFAAARLIDGEFQPLEDYRIISNPV